MLHRSSLLEKLKQHVQTPNGEPLCFYQASQLQNGICL